jgi:predicted alpha/beta hydrolase
MKQLRVSEPFEVVCADGWRLRGEITVGDLPPVAVAIVGHAMMVDRRTLDRPAGRGLVSHLAERGIAVVWADLRGHGQSGPRPEEGGDWTYGDLVEQDLPALMRVARERFPSLPLCAVGHSLFGHVALAHLARHPEAPIAALGLLACNVAHPEWRARPFECAQKGALIELMGLVTRAVGHLPVRRLRLGNNDESRGYVADFVRCWRAGDWCARDGFSYWQALPSVRQPVLALVGARDRFMAPAADVRGLVSRVPRAEVRVVGRSTGLAFDPAHMSLLLDERARPAWDELAQFLRQNLVGAAERVNQL